MQKQMLIAIFIFMRSRHKTFRYAANGNARIALCFGSTIVSHCVCITHVITHP